MARKYTQKRRAEQQEETRARIAQAALDLHRAFGPARTTLSMVAEKAGVQRHTLYAHFPDTRSLFLACSGLHAEQDPPPAGTAWSFIEDRSERLHTGLTEIYDWYARNAELIAGLLRDMELVDDVRQVFHERFGPRMSQWRSALGKEEQTLARKAMLDLALSFHTWRSLAIEGGLGKAAAAAMAERLCAHSP